MTSLPTQPLRAAPGEPAPPEATPPPRSRRSREELREIVLEAGRDVLLSEGLGTGAEHLSFKRVLSHVERTRGIRVTNASVIGRIWVDMADYQAD